MLEVKSLSAGYNPKRAIIADLSFSIDRGEFGCIIGANGCGKTTVLKTMLGLLPALGGTVTLDGRDVLSLSDKERASCLAYIPQSHRLPFPFQVKDVVLMGRTPHLGRFAALDKHDRRVALAALCQLSIEHLADQPYTQLSGGQQQLVLIARALAQQPEVLLMDEPTASLDFGNQQLVLSRMRSLVDGGMSVLMITHDPAHAFYCADRVIALNDGRMLANGKPDEVITAQSMRTIYHTDVRIVDLDVGEGATGYACVPVARQKAGDSRFLKELMRRAAS